MKGPGRGGTQKKGPVANLKPRATKDEPYQSQLIKARKEGGGNGHPAREGERDRPARWDRRAGRETKLAGRARGTLQCPSRVGRPLGIKTCLGQCKLAAKSQVIAPWTWVIWGDQRLQRSLPRGGRWQKKGPIHRRVHKIPSEDEGGTELSE